MTDNRRRLPPEFRPSNCVMVVALLVLCVVVSIWGGFPKSFSEFVAVNDFTISQIRDAGDGNVGLPNDRFASVKAGQVWRVFTPTFIHIGVGHLLHNLVMVYWFCAPIEYHRGHIAFMAGALVTASIANVSNLLWTDMPFFGGASTLWCAAFGYRGLVAVLDPKSALRISKVVTAVGVLSLGIGFFGLVPAANAAHVAAVLGGITFGILDALFRRTRSGTLEANA